MSRIGKHPVPVPKGVTAKVEGNKVHVKGPKGELERTLHPDMKVTYKDDQILVERPSDESNHKALHGLSRTLVANMVIGVTDGYTKTLEIVGTGYRVQARGSDLEFALGFSHPVVVPAPEGITFNVEAPTRFTVSGVDKQQVGEVSANIRKLRKPDPYKGKGVRYQGEVIKRKAGKAGK
jgi:large subunit ribosomal protein L6